MGRPRLFYVFNDRSSMGYIDLKTCSLWRCPYVRNSPTNHSRCSRTKGTLKKSADNNGLDVLRPVHNPGEWTLHYDFIETSSNLLTAQP